MREMKDAEDIDHGLILTEKNANSHHISLIIVHRGIMILMNHGLIIILRQREEDIVLNNSVLLMEIRGMGSGHHILIRVIIEMLINVRSGLVIIIRKETLIVHSVLIMGMALIKMEDIIVRKDIRVPE